MLYTFNSPANYRFRPTDPHSRNVFNSSTDFGGRLTFDGLHHTGSLTNLGGLRVPITRRIFHVESRSLFLYYVYIPLLLPGYGNCKKFVRSEFRVITGGSIWALVRRLLNYVEYGYSPRWGSPLRVGGV